MSPIDAQIIHTTRLDLMPLRAEHAEQMATVLSDPDLYRFIGGAPGTPSALRARYERLVAGSPDPAVSWCNWVIDLHDDPRADLCLVGTVQATITAGHAVRTAEIAWVVGTPWQRRGIATEAAQGLIAWLARLPVHTVIAHIHPDHRASAAVATAAGLTPTGHLHEGEVRWELTMRRSR
ncbi:MAG TPA: GNAT family N-acetyltransferase [Thermopolyspora sp.]